MVLDLWKHIPGHGGDLMHAAVGLAGEVGELAVAYGRAHVLEECGDLEFYLERACLLLCHEPPSRSTIVLAFGDMIDALVIVTSALLDTSKKSWVYEREIQEPIVRGYLSNIYALLSEIYDFLGTTRAAVRRTNMVKLVSKNSGRYASGKYSNEQALARADKPAGE